MQNWLYEMLSSIKKELDKLTVLVEQNQSADNVILNQLKAVSDGQRALLIAESANNILLNRILTILTTPPPQEAAGFTAQLNVDQPKGENTMSPIDEPGDQRKKAAARHKLSAPAPSLTINDDGTATINLNFTDEFGEPITGLTALPTGVAVPVFASSDQNPGPSGFVITPDPSGLFAKVSVVPPVTPGAPLPSNVDFTVTIASGLVGQTDPITEDAGTLSVVADASKPSGFAVQLSTP